MVSLDTSDGSLRWFIQAKPHDQFDHDFQLTPILATVTIAGEAVPLAIGGGKTGTVIAANAETGEEIWRASVGEHNAYGDGAMLPEPSATPVTILPGPFGGVLTPMAYANETIFAPVVNMPLTYTAEEFAADLATASGEMARSMRGTVPQRWRTEVDTFFAPGPRWPMTSSSAAGLDGLVRGFATSTGEEIWRYPDGGRHQRAAGDRGRSAPRAGRGAIPDDGGAAAGRAERGDRVSVGDG